MSTALRVQRSVIAPALLSVRMALVSDKSPQLDKFKQAARDLECDDDDQRFKERLGKLAKAKPAPEKPE